MKNLTLILGTLGIFLFMHISINAQTYNQQSFNFDNTTINHFNVINAEESEEKFVMVTKFYGSNPGDAGKAIKVMRLDASDQVIWSNTYYDNIQEGVRGLRIIRDEIDDYVYVLASVWSNNLNQFVGAILKIDPNNGSLLNDVHFNSGIENFHTYPLDIDISDQNRDIYVGGFNSEDDIWDLNFSSTKNAFFMNFDNNLNINFGNVQSTPKTNSSDPDFDYIARFTEIVGDGYLLLGGRNNFSGSIDYGRPLIQLVDYSGNDIWSRSIDPSGHADVSVDAVIMEGEDDARIFILQNYSSLQHLAVIEMDILGNFIQGKNYPLNSISTSNWYGFDLELAWNQNLQENELRVGIMAAEESNSFSNTSSPSILMNLNINNLSINSSEIYLEVPSNNVKYHGGHFAAFPDNNICDMPFYTPDILTTDNNGQDNYLLGFHRLDTDPISLEYYNLDHNGSNGQLCIGQNTDLIDEELQRDDVDKPYLFENVTPEPISFLVSTNQYLHSIHDCEDIPVEQENSILNKDGFNISTSLDSYSSIADNNSIYAYPTLLESGKSIIIESKNELITSVSLMSMNGKVLFEKENLISKYYRINDTYYLDDELYFLIVKTENDFIYTKKVLVIN